VLGRGQFSAAAILVGCARVLGSGDGVGDQVVLVAVEVGQCAGNRVLDGVGVDSLAARFARSPARAARIRCASSKGSVSCG